MTTMLCYTVARASVSLEECSFIGRAGVRARVSWVRREWEKETRPPGYRNGPVPAIPPQEYSTAVYLPTFTNLGFVRCCKRADEPRRVRLTLRIYIYMLYK